MAVDAKSVPMKKKYKLVQPDGGYGYVIVGAASVNLISGTMFYVSFGIIFNDFFLKMGMSSADITLLTGIRAMCLAVSGFLTGPLLKALSKRKLAFLGCVLFNAGVIGTVFADTKTLFIVCQGLFQSCGLGFMYNIACSSVNDYFKEKRMLAMSVFHTLAAVASMIAPVLVTWSMAELGYHGTLIITASIGMQTFVATSLLQPVAWHMKKVKITEEILEKLLLPETENPDEVNNKLLEPPQKQTDVENADSESFEEEKSNNSAKGGVGSWLSKYLDFPLLKRYAPTCGFYGISIAVFADITYVYFLPQALYKAGWDNDRVKWAFALLGFGDIAFRVAMMLFSACLKKVGNHLLYIFGLLVAIATKLAMFWVTDYTYTLVVLTIMGVSRCTIVVLLPLVVADYVRPEEFATAIGGSFMMFGLLSIVMGPIIGAIADASGDYTIMFVILIALLAGVVMAWICEILRRRRKPPAHTQ